jgi:NlpC/P60 family putative phage cell wall peptidase
MTIDARIVAAARSWIGTPYCHQASLRGAGTDCLGLVRGVWREILGCEPCSLPPYSADWSEAGATEALTQAADQWLVRKDVNRVQSGDILLFRMQAGCIAKHLGIQTDTGPRPAFVHAYGGHAVVESPLSLPWARRIVGRYRFPNGA